MKEHEDSEVPESGEFRTEWCTACGGVFHPATGHRWSEISQLCWACTLSWIRFLKQHTARFGRPWRRPASSQSFLDAALTSIKPPRGNET